MHVSQREYQAFRVVNKGAVICLFSAINVHPAKNLDTKVLCLHEAMEKIYVSLRIGVGSGTGGTCMLQCLLGKDIV